MDESIIKEDKQELIEEQKEPEVVVKTEYKSEPIVNSIDNYKKETNYKKKPKIQKLKVTKKEVQVKQVKQVKKPEEIVIRTTKKGLPNKNDLAKKSRVEMALEKMKKKEIQVIDEDSEEEDDLDDGEEFEIVKLNEKPIEKVIEKVVEKPVQPEPIKQPIPIKPDPLTIQSHPEFLKIKMENENMRKCMSWDAHLKRISNISSNVKLRF